MLVVLDVNPAETGLHHQILLKSFGGCEALGNDVAGVENEHQGRMIDLVVNFGHDLAGLANEVGLNLQSEREVRAVAGFGDLAELIDDLRQVVARVSATWVIKRKAADELRLEGVGQLARS